MQQIWRLRHFIEVADKGSVHAAARAINISQPALTKSIRVLEGHVGVDLFERTARGVRLTEAGRLLYARAREIDMAWSASLAELGGHARGAGGHLHVGAGPVYSTVYFPEVLARMQRHFPRLRIEVSTGVGSAMLPLVKSGDLTLYAGALPAERVGAGFETLPLTRQGNVLAAGADHPLFARPRPVDVADLLDHPWLRLVYDHQASAHVAAFFARAGLSPPHYSVETPSLLMAIQLLSHKGFITSLPAPLVRALTAARLRVLPFADFTWHLSTGVTVRKTALALSPVATLIEILRQLAAEDVAQD